MLITCVGGGNAGQILGPVEERLALRVPDVEKRRIESHRFYLITGVSPSNTVTFRGNPFPAGGQFQVLIVEWNFLFRLRGEPDELGAILLHEIGHTLNPAVPNLPDREHRADDYARLCRYGPPLARNLKRCLQANMEGFEQAATNERIRRIESDEQLKLDLLAALA